MIKLTKKIVPFLAFILLITLVPGCSLFGGDSTTEPPADEGDGDLLTGRLGQDFTSDTVVAPELDVTTQKLELFKESNPALNKFYYGDQVPVIRFSATPTSRDMETLITDVLFSVNVTGNITTSNYTLYDLENRTVAISDPVDLRANKTVLFEGLSDVSIPANFVGEKKYELRAKIEKVEDGLKAEPSIDVELTKIEVSGA